MALPETKCLVHIKPNRHQSWGVHAEATFYIGPALKHYQCYKAVMQHTGTKQITDTILFQHNIPLPAVFAMDHLLTAIKQLQDAITHHVIPMATTEKKQLTLCELFTPPAKLKSPVNKSKVSETMDHSHSNTMQSRTPYKALHGLSKQIIPPYHTLSLRMTLS